MKFIKTLFSVIIITALVVASVPFSVSADKVKGTIYPFVPAVKTYYSEAEEYIANALREQKSSVNISSFNIPQDDIIYVIRSVMFDNPDIFYIDSAYIPYEFDKKTGIIVKIKPQYIFKRSKISAYIKKFNKASQKLIEGIDSSWSDVKKALILHDRLAVKCRYKNEGLKSYTAYNVIVSGKGICEGYSRAYSYLLSLVGVDSKTVNNEKKFHCWNLVKLNGSWYHVDVTSDDPLPDVSGYVRHKFFLLTDVGLKNVNSKEHSGYKSDITYNSSYACGSSKYNTAFFKSVNTQCVAYKDNYYYIKNNYKGKNYSVLIRKNGSSKKILKVIKDNRTIKYGAKYRFYYSNICEYNKFIYFNTKRKIIRYNPATGKFKSILKLPSFIKSNFIGIEAKGSSLYVTKLNSSMTKLTLKKTVKISKKNKAVVLPFLKYTSKILKKKNSFKLKVYYGSGKVSYKSSNKKIAKVSSKGRVKTLKKGSCTITAVRNNKKLKCKIKVV